MSRQVSGESAWAERPRIQEVSILKTHRLVMFRTGVVKCPILGILDITL